MDTEISKSRFKAKALEYFREIEQTGNSVVITDHGEPALEIRPFRRRAPAESLKGTVLRYQDPTAPVAEENWESAR